MMALTQHNPSHLRKIIMKSSRYSWDIDNEFNIELRQSYIRIALDAMQKGFYEVDDYIDLKLKHRNKFYQVKDDVYTTNPSNKADFTLNSENIEGNIKMLKYGGDIPIFRRK